MPDDGRSSGLPRPGGAGAKRSTAALRSLEGEGPNDRATPPLLPPPFLAVGARRGAKDHRRAEEVRAALAAAVAIFRTDPNALTQLVDARAVAGERHLASALARAARARAQGRSHLADPGAEFLLYLSGTDQFPGAVARAGIRDDSRELVLVLSPPGDVHGLLVRTELEEDPSVFPRAPDEAVLERVGIDRASLQLVPRGRWELLAIEAGALVDLPRAGGQGRGKG